MPTCENCGGYVTQRYMDVFEPEDRDEARCCPGCRDKVRDGSDVREAHSPRVGARRVK